MQETNGSEKDSSLFTQLSTEVESTKQPLKGPSVKSKDIYDSSVSSETSESAKKDRDRYRGAFEDAPVSLWQVDYSDVEKFMEILKNEGVTDIRAYLELNPDILDHIAAKIQVLDINQTTMDLYNAPSKQDLLAPLKDELTSRNTGFFKKQLATIFEGGDKLETHTIGKKVNGADFPLHMKIKFSRPGRDSRIALVSAEDTTRHTNGQIPLNSSELGYRQMFEANLAVQLLIDPETGCIIDANQAASDFYGYTCDQLKSMKIVDINVQQSAKTFKDMGSVIRGEQNRFNFVHKLASGKLREVESLTGRIQIEDKNYIYSIIHDITASRKAEKELKEYREMFSLFTDQIPAIVYIKDEKGRMQFVNQEMIKLFGADQWLGKTAMEYIPEDMAKRIEAEDRIALERGHLLSEAWVLTNNSDIRCFQSHKFRLKRGAKAPLLGGVAVDITDRKLFEHSLEMRDKLLEGLARAFQRLLRGEDLPSSIESFLSIIGTAADVDRVYIFEAHQYQNTEEWLMSQRYEWTSSAKIKQIDNPELIDLPFQPRFDRWFNHLTQGKPIKGLVKDFPECEQEILFPQDIISILVAPLIIDSEFYGFMGFDDLRRQRQWSDVEVSLLMAAAGGLSFAIKREKAESKLLESKETLEAFFNAITECAFLMDKDGFLLAVNTVMEKKYGLTNAKLEGKSCLELENGPIGPTNNILFRKVVDSAQPCIFREELEYEILETSLYPVLNPDGAVESVAGFSRDITDQVEFEKKLQQAYEELEQRVWNRTQELIETNKGLNAEIANRLITEKALTHSEQRLDLALKGADLGLWDHNFVTGDCYYDEGWGKILGYSVNELERMDPFWEDLIHPDDLPDVRKAFDDHVNTKTNFYESEHRLKAKSGEWKWILSRGKIVEWDANGNPARFTGTLLDLSERKLAEERLKVSLHEKEILLAEIHHRVKNNLQIVSSLLSLQSGHVQDTNVLNAIQDSQSRVRSMALIHDQLYQSHDLTKIDFSVYVKNLTQSLLLTYGQMTSYVNLSIKAENIYFAIETAIPCGLIITELVTNSLKHAFNAGRTGEIKVEFSSTGPDGYIMVVSDTGKGLPEDLDIRKSKSLGLRLVRELAEVQLMGRLEVSSKQGTEFRISFKSKKR